MMIYSPSGILGREMKHFDGTLGHRLDLGMNWQLKVTWLQVSKLSVVKAAFPSENCRGQSLSLPIPNSRGHQHPLVHHLLSLYSKIATVGEALLTQHSSHVSTITLTSLTLLLALSSHFKDSWITLCPPG